MIYQNITEMIGHTPLISLPQEEHHATILAKIESFNPGGSIKDRAAFEMLKQAQQQGILKKGDTIIEATSGNMGIALSMIGAALDYHVIIVMPETMSIERRRMIKAYGATLILTPGKEGMKGAVDKANELAQKHHYIQTKQFENQANVKAHEKTTALEIWDETKGQIDAFVAGVGTGGTLAGVSTILKEKKETIQTVAIQPKTSPVLTHGKAGGHGIQGIGANFIPAIYDDRVIDEIMDITDEEAFEQARKLGCEMGLLVGISSGANIAAAKKIAKTLGKGKTVVTVLPDTGERYLSTALFAEHEK